MNELYDVHGLVKAFGGRLGLIEKLKRGAGKDVKKKTVDKWMERGSIPADYLIYCQITAEKLGMGVSITDFITGKRGTHDDRDTI